jgi:prepilin-type N-terminal cleavage/methylation domain-containing protein
MLIKFGKKGFSLVELLASIIVGGIVILMVAALGTIATKSYKGLRNNSGVYNDSQFALQLIREGVRQSLTPGPTVVSSVTLANNSIQMATATCSKLRFYVIGTTLYYDRTCGALNNNNLLLISGVTNFIPCNSSSSNPPCTSPVTGQLIGVTLSGVNSGNNYSYTIYATRRNP